MSHAATPEHEPEPEPIHEDGLQFDHAEYHEAVSQSVTCSLCRQPILDQYFEVNQKVLCTPCRNAVESKFRGGSRPLRFMKAGLFGFGAAFAGAVLTSFIRWVTGGWEFGLISLVTGYMVGTSIRSGTGNRGGRVYQLIAVFLTYSSLCWSYLPDLTKEFYTRAVNEREAKQKAQLDPPLRKDEPPKAGMDADAAAKTAARTDDPTTKDPSVVADAASPAAPPSTKEVARSEVTDNTAKPGPETSGENALASDSSEPKTAAASDKVGAEKKAVDPPAAARPAQPIEGDLEPLPGPGMLLLGSFVFLGVLLVLCYILPILVNVQSMPNGLIGLFILFIGMQTAWRLTQRVTLNFKGPFMVGGLDNRAPRVFDNG